MQKVSDEYKKSIKQFLRNRGYIRATLGMINQEAQKTASIDTNLTKYTYFSNKKNIFDGTGVLKPYATTEENFSKVDGSMFFLPPKKNEASYYNNGLVVENFTDYVWIDFLSTTNLDIKGLMIDFGHSFPKKFMLEWNNGTKIYENSENLFVSEDIFEGATWLKITPIEMSDGHVRLRIYGITFGIAKIFTNQNVRNYSFKEYISPISETIPSQDMSIEIDNQNLYYSVDNPESAFSFLEVGQELRVSFGYDVSGNGDIEWLPENTCFLKTWKADDIKAVFDATDRFDYMSETYYKGTYSKNGITLYDLAVQVLSDAGITNSEEYYLDPALKNIVVNNPLPPVKHTEALQIIANAGRCVLYQDRNKRIHMESTYISNLSAETTETTEYSETSELLKDSAKKSYAVSSKDFSTVEGDLYFMPKGNNYLKTGYVSKEISDQSGYFQNGNPKITIKSEELFTAYGLEINFRNIAPEQFKIRIYAENELIKQKTIENPDIHFVTDEIFENYDKMEIEFVKTASDSRVFIDNVIVSDIAEYTLERKCDIYGSPVGERKNKVKSISVVKNTYNESSEEIELLYEELRIEKGRTQHTVYFDEPCYDFSVSVENPSVTANIIAQSNYMAVLEFYKVSSGTETVRFKINGKKYSIDKQYSKMSYNSSGEEIIWDNPLVSSQEHAQKVRDWIATHLLGDVEYNITWRGDPRIDAGDLVYLELKDRPKVLTRIYEQNLSFNGAWKSTAKVRKAVVKWQ